MSDFRDWVCDVFEKEQKFWDKYMTEDLDCPNDEDKDNPDEYPL